MTMQTAFSAPGDGTRLAALDAVHTVKIPAAATDGRYELFEIALPRGHDVPPHRHPWPEAYYVLHGTLRVDVDGTSRILTPGSSLAVPPQAAHALASDTPATAFLAFTLTGAMGAFFADFDAGVPHERPLEEVVPVVMEIAARHDVHFVTGERP